MKRKDRFGFTLIELLVVIAVIAIIAAILFPTFAQAREKARQTVCLSNLHQIGLASELYTQDYDETLLWEASGSPTPGSTLSQQILQFSHQQVNCVNRVGMTWVGLLRPYVKSDGVFRCPSFPGFAVPTSWQGPQLVLQGVGYSVNPLQFDDPCRPHPLSWLRHSPSQVALFADVTGEPGNVQWTASVYAVNNWIYPLWLSKQWNYSPDGNTYWDWQQYRPPVPDPSMEPLARARHGDGYNFAFADGHAKFLRPWWPRGWQWQREAGGLGVDGQYHQGEVYDHSGYFPGAMAD
jgi:prepilin-type N-terminal cleavage/methylation domain-containing protein/prepilin-type processing-associated H-X9-DG protein